MMSYLTKAEQDTMWLPGGGDTKFKLVLHDTFNDFKRAFPVQNEVAFQDTEANIAKKNQKETSRWKTAAAPAPPAVL